jgi:hypothetical protein
MWNQSKLFYACKRIHYLAEKKETIKLLWHPTSIALIC